MSNQKSIKKNKKKQNKKNSGMNKVGFNQMVDGEPIKAKIGIIMILYSLNYPIMNTQVLIKIVFIEYIQL